MISQTFLERGFVIIHRYFLYQDEFWDVEMTMRGSQLEVQLLEM